MFVSVMDRQTDYRWSSLQCESQFMTCLHGNFLSHLPNMRVYINNSSNTSSDQHILFGWHLYVDRNDTCIERTIKDIIQSCFCTSSVFLSMSWLLVYWIYILPLLLTKNLISQHQKIDYISRSRDCQLITGQITLGFDF